MVNCGSSSVKYQLFDAQTEMVLAKDTIEGLSGTPEDYEKAFSKMRSDIAKNSKVASDWEERLAAIGHRVVHGGTKIWQSQEITPDTPEVIAVIEEFSRIAPLHNPPNLAGIRACQKLFPRVRQVAVFDTAFHATIPETAYMYAIDYETYKKYGLRKYGFHGTSHRIVALKAARFLGKRPEECNFITCHMGNGSSVTAIRNGESKDTSMGLSPLEGVMMGTRTGNIDPAMVEFLAPQAFEEVRADLRKRELRPVDIDALALVKKVLARIVAFWNKKCGVLGVSGVSKDFREVKKALGLKDTEKPDEIRAAIQKIKQAASQVIDEKDPDAKQKEKEKRCALALEMFAYRVALYIGSYYAILGRVDAIIFTGGIGENDATVRQMIMDNLFPGAKEKLSGTQFLVVPTNEELMILKDTKRVLGIGAQDAQDVYQGIRQEDAQDIMPLSEAELRIRFLLSLENSAQIFLKVLDGPGALWQIDTPVREMLLAAFENYYNGDKTGVLEIWLGAHWSREIELVIHGKQNPKNKVDVGRFAIYLSWKDVRGPPQALQAKLNQSVEAMIKLPAEPAKQEVDTLTAPQCGVSGSARAAILTLVAAILAITAILFVPKVLVLSEGLAFRLIPVSLGLTALVLFISAFSAYNTGRRIRDWRIRGILSSKRGIAEYPTQGMLWKDLWQAICRDNLNKTYALLFHEIWHGVPLLGRFNLFAYAMQAIETALVIWLILYFSLPASSFSAPASLVIAGIRQEKLASRSLRHNLRIGGLPWLVVPILAAAAGLLLLFSVPSLWAYEGISPVPEAQGGIAAAVVVAVGLFFLAVLAIASEGGAGKEASSTHAGWLGTSAQRIIGAYQTAGPITALDGLFPQLITEANNLNNPELTAQALKRAFDSISGSAEQRRFNSVLGRVFTKGLRELEEKLTTRFPQQPSGYGTIWTLTTSPAIDIDVQEKLKSLENWYDSTKAIVTPGGGGLNIAIALAERGVLARPVFFYAGERRKGFAALIAE
jgi:acetate kinase